MFNKKMFLLLCSLGAIMVPGMGLAMNGVPLNAPCLALVRAMNPLFEARACTPETLDNLSMAVGLVESVLGPQVSASAFLEDGSIDLRMTIHGAIDEHNYRRIVVFYRLMLDYVITNAWGMMEPADLALLQRELARSNAEFERLCPTIERTEPVPSMVAQVLVGSGLVAVIATSVFALYKLVNRK